MSNLLHKLTSKFLKATLRAYPEIESPPIEIAQSKEICFGNYQFNSCMKLAKTLKKTPREVANTIIENLAQAPEIASLEIAGPGFINITIDKNFIAGEVEKILIDPHLGVELPKKKRVIVEFSSPNTAKELHVGHLRSTIIGECLARLLKFLGHDVLRINHIGDWGTQFGMLIAFIKEQDPSVLDGTKETDLEQLVTWYKQAKHRFDHDPSFKKLSQQEVVNLQSGEKHALKAWDVLCGISRKAYNEIYRLLDVKLIERGESFYNPMLPKVIEELEEKGLIELSNGAKCLYPPGFLNREGDPLPLMLQKSDGGFGYDTTDMAAMKQRIFEESADRIIIVTDMGQTVHFQMIFSAAKMAGWLEGRNIKLDHVPFGLVLGSDGKKFRTRSGETEKLIDLLLTAIKKAKMILKEKNPDMSEGEVESIAKNLGLGAIKYADLSCHRTHDYTFSYDRMLRFEGNTAAYLMYSYVRINSIKKRVNKDVELKSLNLCHPSEIALGLHLIQFSESLESVEQELLPNRLTDYLYILALKFNAFYRDCQVEGDPNEASRLFLCDATAQVLKKGLFILGLETVERM